MPPRHPGTRRSSTSISRQFTGRSIRNAAVEACCLRFRPIITTSFAFILGVPPLVFATGAASRQSLGTAVFGGMITSTVLTVFFVPAFDVAIQTLTEWLHPPRGGHEFDREKPLRKSKEA